MPAPEPATTNAEWSVGLRLWLERRGEAVLGQGRAELLILIDRTHSISAAAREMGMSYRHAWLLVQSANQSAGEPLVEAAVGGRHGGGARLTPRGRQAIEIYTQLHAELRAAAALALPRALRVPDGARPTVHLLAAISLQEVVGQLLAEYALIEPTVVVRAMFGASNALADQLLAGAVADLFLSADAAHLDRLIGTGQAVRASGTALARNGLALIAAPGRAWSIRGPRDLLADDVRRIAVADAASPLGQCSLGYLRRMRLAGPLEGKWLRVDNSRAVLAAVRGGQADVGLAFSSDTLDAGQCTTLYRVRPQSASVEYAGAVLTRGIAAHEAGQLLEFLHSRTGLSCFRRCGFQAPGRASARKA